MSDNAKRRVGRPTKYDPAYCEAIVAALSAGKSLCEFAAEIGVARSTIDQWASDQHQFSEALTRAKAAEQAWWERTGREALFSERFQAAVWKKSVEARFRNDYTERKELNATVGVHEAALDQLDRS